MIGKLCIYLAIFVASIAVALTLVYTPEEIYEMFSVFLNVTLLNLFRTSPSTQTQNPSKDKVATKDSSRSSGSKDQLFTVDELKLYTGEKGSKGLYLAILGNVYDVSKGKKHYGPKGGYHFFSGKDGTRAFVSGDFTEKGLIPDVTGLTHQDILGIDDWMKLYEKDYKYVGKLTGHYYDEMGEPTAKWHHVESARREAKEWKSKQEDETRRYPPCNSEWSQDKGGRVWCSTKSGGIDRPWTGVPRRMFKAGSKDYRCACIKEDGRPSTGDADPSPGDRGDLDLPNLKEYPDCDPTSSSCKIP